MAIKPLPSQEVLRQLLDYNPETGVLTWKLRDAKWFRDGKRGQANAASTWNTKNAGKIAFQTALPEGHLYAGFMGRKLLAHRVAWKWVTGNEPMTVDHINGNPSDNRWVNLRSVRHKINSRNCKLSKNNSSGVTGVCWDKRRKLWVASLHVNYRKIHLGQFQTLEAAAAARRAAEREHGFHPNHGRKT